MSRRFTTGLLLLFLGFSAAALIAQNNVPSNQSGKMVIFQYPDWDTLPDAINDARQIAGHLGDEPGGEIGFLRQADGTIQTFAYPMDGCVSAPDTRPYAIDNYGTIAGEVYCAYYDQIPSFGFIRKADGNVTFVTDPDGHGLSIRGMNDLGFTVGVAGNATFVTPVASRGFVRDPYGNINYLDVAPNVVVLPYDIDNSGTVVGWYAELDATTQKYNDSGFVYRDGKYNLYRFGGNTRFLWINNVTHEVLGTVDRNGVRDWFLMKKNGQVRFITEQVLELGGSFHSLNRHGDIVGARQGDTVPDIYGFLALHAIK